jgi:hypothetical protein
VISAPVTFAEAIDATTPVGKLQMHILGAVAEFERGRPILDGLIHDALTYGRSRHFPSAYQIRSGGRRRKG